MGRYLDKGARAFTYLTLLAFAVWGKDWPEISGVSGWLSGFEKWWHGIFSYPTLAALLIFGPLIFLATWGYRRFIEVRKIRLGWADTRDPKDVFLADWERRFAHSRLRTVILTRF